MKYSFFFYGFFFSVFLCILEIQGSITIEPEFPQSEETLRLIVEGEEWDYLLYAWDLPFSMTPEQFPVEKFIRIPLRTVMEVPFPSKNSLFYFILERKNGSRWLENGVGTFISRYGEDGKPVRNACYYRAMIIKHWAPNHYSINDWLEAELDQYPDNFPAYYMYWRHNGGWEDETVRESAAATLGELELEHAGDPTFWELAAQIYLDWGDFERADFAFTMQLNHVENLDSLLRIQAKRLTYIMKLDPFVPLLDSLWGMKTYSALTFFHHYVIRAEQLRFSNLDQTLRNGLNAAHPGIRELAAYYLLLNQISTNPSYTTEWNDWITLVLNSELLTFRQLNRLLGVMAFYPDLNRVFLELAERCLQKWNLMKRNLKTTDLNSPTNEKEYFEIVFKEYLAWAYYLSGNSNRALALLEDIFSGPWIPDDLLFFRAGCIYQANNQLQSALEYFTKAWLLNYQGEIQNTILEVYREQYGSESGLSDYIESMKSDTYQPVDWWNQLADCPSLNPSWPTAVLVIEPGIWINLDDWYLWGQLVQSRSPVNFLVVYPNDMELTDDIRENLEFYQISHCALERPLIQMLSGRQQLPLILLFNRQHYFINRLSIQRPDWQSIVHQFIKSQ